MNILIYYVGGGALLLFILALVFLASRKLVLWYFRIDEIVALLKHIAGKKPGD